ncbi:MAG: TorF family putative porin, partial [Alphaproteobacteria bacterium]
MNELVRGIGTAILATSVLLPFGASAAEKSKVPGTFSANVGLVSEYYFRGISQNDDTPALQGSFDYEISLAKPVMAYVGVWGSNVDFNEGTGVDGASIEINYYGGLKGNIGDSGVGWDVGFIYYSYPG